jgi:hypothetical protein
VTDSAQLGFEALATTAATPNHARLLERLVPLAQELARVRPSGLTVGDLRVEAVRRRLLPAIAKGRELSFLGAIMRKAGLVSTEEFRRSEIKASHGNPHVVYRRP